MGSGAEHGERSTRTGRGLCKRLGTPQRLERHRSRLRRAPRTAHSEREFMQISAVDGAEEHRSVQRRRCRRAQRWLHGHRYDTDGLERDQRRSPTPGPSIPLTQSSMNSVRSPAGPKYIGFVSTSELLVVEKNAHQNSSLSLGYSVAHSGSRFGKARHSFAGQPFGSLRAPSTKSLG